MTALLCAIIAVLAWYMIDHERNVKRQNIELQLKNICSTIVQAYEEQQDLQTVVDFINVYNNNTTLDDLRISVYDPHKRLLASSGTVLLSEDPSHHIAPEIAEIEQDDNVDQVSSVRKTYTDRKTMMFSAMWSNDGYIRVLAATPYSISLNRALSYDPMVWIIVGVLLIASLGISYYTTGLVARSVYQLRDFAAKATAGTLSDKDADIFPSNELGDVSRQIMQIYMAKDKALRRSVHEHEVAMRAVNERELVKRQMSNNINHELKTPVGIIKGYLDTINSDPDMPESLRRSFLEKAQQHADRLTQLLKDVSSITRLDDGSQQVEITEFDFHDLVYTMANDLEVSHINGSLEFDWHIPFDCMVLGNYTLLSNALMNLVRNSANYSRGTRITLALVGQTSEAYTFVFADNGVGVGEEHLSRLFDRFYRVDEGRARKSGGTGLGLPIVKSTFSAIGGSIEVTNDTPHGLKFTFTIPRPQHNDPKPA